MRTLNGTIFGNGNEVARIIRALNKRGVEVLYASAINNADSSARRGQVCALAQRKDGTAVYVLTGNVALDCYDDCIMAVGDRKKDVRDRVLDRFCREHDGYAPKAETFGAYYKMTMGRL